MLEKLGYDSAKTFNKAEEKIKSKIESVYSFNTTDFSNACYYVSTEPAESNKMINCYDKAYELFQFSIGSNSNLFFTNNDGV